MKLLAREPVAVVTAIEAVLALLLAFGVGLSGEQVATIVALSTAVLGLVARSRVSPTGSPDGP